MMIDPAITNEEIRRGLTTSVRVIPPPDLLDADLRLRIEAQQHVLRYVVGTLTAAVDAPLDAAVRIKHAIIPCGWWFSAHALGLTDARGRVSMIAAGINGVPLGYRLGPDLDHRWQGLDAMAWAVIATHESAHAAHHLLIGIDAAAAALMDTTRQPGQEVEGFAGFVRHVHQRVTGKPLPEGFNAARWPLGAPGLAGWLEGLANAVLPFAVEPAPAQRPCSEADWLEAQRLSFSQDLHDLMREREAASRWRAACAEPTP